MVEAHLQLNNSYVITAFRRHLFGTLVVIAIVQPHYTVEVLGIVVAAIASSYSDSS